ncbi:MbcA/ParS/Xre antitoxin family protein [Rhodanobacter aciditrophus]|uniref:MbcA/ParS/Xre antitoxin family protein n=1 Tax=Rhodanobacter aciditrophus TaxID=1623218 RepID=A0ABW4B5J0_9GAMM
MAIQNSVEVIGSWRVLEQNNQGVSLAKDVEENISHLIAIYRLTQAVFPGKESSWIRRSNQYFNDRSPYAIMLNGKTGAETVRSYLEALSQDNYM